MKRTRFILSHSLHEAFTLRVVEVPTWTLVVEWFFGLFDRVVYGWNYSVWNFFVTASNRHERLLVVLDVSEKEARLIDPKFTDLMVDVATDV